MAIKDVPKRFEHRQWIDTHVDGGPAIAATVSAAAHGTLSTDGPPASLLILEFGILLRHMWKSIRKAKISVTFTDLNSPDNDPEVVRFEPNDILPFAFSSASKRELDRYGWPNMHILGKEVINKTHLRDLIRSKGRSNGKKNSVQFIMKENQITKGGIYVTHVRTPILIKRATLDDDVQVRIEIDTTVDTIKSKVRKLFRPAFPLFNLSPKNDKADPTLSEPIQGVDASNLDDVDLKSLVYASGPSPFIGRGW